MSKYYKPKSKKVIKIATFIKGLTGTIGMSALVADYKWVGITVLLAGAVANEVINFCSDDTQEAPDQAPENIANDNESKNS
jgi:hypothetical protein